MYLNVVKVNKGGCGVRECDGDREIWGMRECGDREVWGEGMLWR